MQDDTQYQDVYQTQPVRSDEIYAAELQSQRIANIVEQTSPDKQLAEVEWRIKGYRKDFNSGTWIKVDKSIPEPSALMVARYISFLGSLLNDNTRWTNLSGSEINSIMKLIIEYIADDLEAHGDEYGLRDNYTERTRIGYIILQSTFFVLKRAQNGTESRRMWNAINMNIAESTGQQNQKKGFLESLKFWKQ